MKNAHIAFVSVPVASHLNPTIPIVSALVRRGHRVSYAVCAPFVSRVEAVGAEIVEYRFGMLSAKAVDETSFCRLALSTLASIARFYENNPPDLIIYDLTAFAGRILGTRWRIPMVKTSPHFAFQESIISRQVPDATFRDEVLAAVCRAKPFLEQHGIRDDGFIFHREKLNIQLFPRPFEPCDEAVDTSCFYAGRCAGEQAGIGDWRHGAVNDRPIVLVAPSRSYMQGIEYVRTCVAAFADLQLRVILSIDDDAEASALVPLPANFEIVQRTSHTKILRYAALAVSMGGTGTGSEAAYHGVPMVMTSLGFKELEWLSDNLARVGLGVHLRAPEVRAEALRSATLQLLRDATIHRKVIDLQRAVRREAGAEETANRIEDYLEEHYAARTAALGGMKYSR